MRFCAVVCFIIILVASARAGEIDGTIYEAGQELKGASVKLINQNKPKYLFVDTAINRKLDNEIIDINTPEVGYLNLESEWRVNRLESLYKIYDLVKKDYVSQESGYLISVYKRKTIDHD